MKIQQLNKFTVAFCMALWGAQVVFCSDAWAISGGCTYPIDVKAGAGGMGGTGMPAQGGIGGTGVAPRSEPIKGEVAGSILFSQGNVEAQSEGRTRSLAKGASVCVGETIVTSPSSQVQIRMADGGLISMRPETKIRINAFHFDGKEDGTEKSEIALMQGSFRALTGLVGHTHKENYVIQTPNAYIGIRGTDHEPVYIPNPAPGQAAAGVPGTYDKVNSGGVVIRTPQGSVEVKPNQVGFASNDPAAHPLLLKELPKFYRAESGAENNHAGAESHEGHETSGEAAGHGHDSESGQGAEIHAPEPGANEVKSPEVKVPEVQVPEVQTPESHGSGD